MTADLTPAQAARLEAIEAAPWAEEAAVERVARAICESDGEVWCGDDGDFENDYRKNAVAAIDVMRGATDDGARTPACGDLSPSINFGGDGEAERFMCELAVGHDGAHEHDNGDGMPPMRWIARATDDGAVGRVSLLADEFERLPGDMSVFASDVARWLRDAIGAPATAEGDADRG